MTYEDAMAEMQQILKNMENQELDVDELSNKVKRVKELHKYCQQKLRTTKDEVEKIINEMDDDEEQASGDE